MKQQLLIRRAGIIGAICLLIISLSSCLKNHDNDYVPTPVALVSAINASPDAQPLDFFLDNNRGSDFSIKSGESMDYIRAYTGKRNISFTLSGSTQKVKTDTATFRDGRLYSVFISNVASSPDYLITKDTVSEPTSGMATVRFVNLSPNTPSASLAIQNGATLVSNKAYRTYSSFVPVQGNQSITFEIRQGSTTTVLATLAPMTLRPRSVYTVWLQGVNGATDATKLSAHIQDNVDYY